MEVLKDAKNFSGYNVIPPATFYRMANSVDPDEMAGYELSHLHLYFAQVLVKFSLPA